MKKSYNKYQKSLKYIYRNVHHDNLVVYINDYDDVNKFVEFTKSIDSFLIRPVNRFYVSSKTHALLCIRNHGNLDSGVIYFFNHGYKESIEKSNNMVISNEIFSVDEFIEFIDKLLKPSYNKKRVH